MINKLIEKLYLRQKDNLVYYDSLTHVKTRMYYDRVCKIKYLKYKCYIMFVDIDSLKKINDTQGHQQGNVVIQRVAQQLNSLEGLYDVCRIGGDEFVAFLSKDFDFSQMNKIKQISYGYCLKDEYSDISYACEIADSYMYIHKNKKKKKKASKSK